MNTIFAVLLVFVGCCSNVVFLELLVRKFPGCGNIVTFAQFAFIALEGFIFETNFGRKKPAIPMSNYVIMVTMFFTVSVINNYALNFNIAMPLHMIFRSGSLIANMILGIIILKKRYSMSKYLSIAMVSLGIFICTIMSARQVNTGAEGSEEQDVYALLHWLLGIAMLTFALLMSARMGIFQETLYKQYGKHSKEALFYNHCLPLPGFLLLSSDIYNHCVLFSQSTPVEVPVIGQAVPVMWLYLLINVITQYVCIRGVFILTTECASLTVTLVVTLRKFISLIISILYFKNPFTAWHWVGTAVVFLGTLIYTEVWTSVRMALRGKEELKEKKAE
ncbi:UDP-xylose and UDP-N-acetylglucosamine transporter isoform X1 [Salmo salar]|uniref:Solute carrier family 35 member B4 n=1 Tax=Salmo salar TaxID=8030 RepID=B5X459_SALSA|nr:UDP-xylose and UDP-N-acetylglucosamine transporter isoform X1 [Salmo salar]ACI34090.1 UDP-xylose and UDP-N-acetylglucosamine transporter [Salmo salar]|eukprot:XP_013981313.1 PREDICTED: UDP-xylose and UDP-N-acetylglucosamine transporter isoform X1 [Salmo salar]